MLEGPLQQAANRLRLPLEELRQQLLLRKVVTARDEIETFLREEQARATRDGLARMLYSRG